MYGPNLQNKDRVALKVEDSTWSSFVDLRAVSTTGVLTVQARETPTLYDVVVKIMPSVSSIDTLYNQGHQEQNLERQENIQAEQDSRNDNSATTAEERTVEGSSSSPYERRMIGTSLHRTKVVQIAPHYIICNNLPAMETGEGKEMVLLFKQHGTPTHGRHSRTLCLKSGEKRSFHWSDFRQENRTITMTLQKRNKNLRHKSEEQEEEEQIEHWTSPMTLDDMGDYVLSFFNGSASKRRIVKVVLKESNDLGSAMFSMEEERKHHAKYQLSNRTMDTITFRQQLLGEGNKEKGKQTQQNIISNIWRTLSPNQSCSFGWLDLMQKNKKIEISIGNVKRVLDIADVTQTSEIHLHPQKGTTKNEDEAFDDAVYYRSPVGLENCLDGLQWCCKKESRGWVSKRSHTEMSPIFFIKMKNNNDSHNHNNDEQDNDDCVRYGDIVILCCEIDKKTMLNNNGQKQKKTKKMKKKMKKKGGGQQEKEEEHYHCLQISKKGRCKWREKKNNTPQKFQIVKQSSSVSTSVSSVLHMKDEYALKVVYGLGKKKKKMKKQKKKKSTTTLTAKKEKVGKEEHESDSDSDTGNDYIGCLITSLNSISSDSGQNSSNNQKKKKRSQKKNTITPKDRRSFDNVEVERDEREKEEEGNKRRRHKRSSTQLSSYLAMLNQKTDPQNIILYSQSTKKNGSHVLRCISLETLPRRTIYQYMTLRGNTRDIQFSLTNPDVVENLSESEGGVGEGGEVVQKKSGNDEKNAADFIEGMSYII